MTDSQFVEFFYAAVAGRDTSEIEGERGHFVIANTSQMPGEERDTVFLALPDPDEYSLKWADESPICQTGQCVECGSSVRSIAKHAICPICESKVYCT
jgi:predicted Zn-ribbon and HTH transcriptional regulator